MKEKCTCTTAASSIKSVMAGMVAVTTGLILASASFADDAPASNRTAASLTPSTPWSAQGPAAQNNRKTLQKGVAPKRDHSKKGAQQGGIAGANPSCPNPSHDCYSTGTPGCSDEACCNAVCDCDPFCCSITWDVFCATTGYAPDCLCPDTGCGAINICGAPPAPANDNCADRIEIFQGDTPFSTLGATTDGPETTCNGFGDPQVNQDIWYNFHPLVSDVYTVNTCGSTFDTKIAIYDGCTCPPGAEIACNDDAAAGPCIGTLQSSASFDGIAGNCYKIRIGGFTTASGSGNVNISQGAPPPVCGDPNNHDCCTTGGPGCSDEKCCNAVCAVDAFCCAVSWDGICVGEAGVICGQCGAVEFCPAPTFPACPNPEHDCFTTGTAGCSDEECCNTVCGADTFCCNVSWDGLCVSEATSMCSGGGSSCPQVSCPPGGVAEGEPCCDDTNGGCNSAPPIFSTLQCGQTVCALQWAFGNIRDTDWYTFETGGGLVTWTVNAEFPSIAFLASNCCPPTLLAQGAAGCQSIASADLPAGSYLAIEVPASFTGLPCGSKNNDYTGTLECNPPCIGDITGDGLVNTADLLQVINHWGPCP